MITEAYLRRHMAALKIYFDVVEERSGSRPVSTPSGIFGLWQTDVIGQHDLGHFGAATVDVAALLAHCRTRYGAIAGLPLEMAQLLAPCSLRDRRYAARLREMLLSELTTQS